jgi:serine/threonine-protein kinase
MSLFRKKKETPDPDATKVGGVVVRPLLGAADLVPGTVVAGYRIQGELGRGGMGVVYRAEHLHLGRPVALKILQPGLAGDFRERFVRESRLAASLSHPNIVTVYDAGEADGVLWIAMELVGGTDLRKRLVDEGRRDPEEVVRIAEQVASALDTAHAGGLVHRDVKPANILLDRGHAWLTDFGLTKRLESRSDLTGKNDIVGTPDYLAPEQIEGATPDGRVDQYALACVVHHALTGTPPFERDSDIAVLQAHLGDPPPRVSEVRSELSEAVDEMLVRAMAKEPGERFPTAGDFVASLAKALGVAAGNVAESEPAASRGYVMVGVADPSTRAVIRAALGRGTADMVEVADTRDLLAHAADTPPALVLLDLGLPGLDVRAAIRELRSGPSERMPVVALAERGHDEQWRAAIAAGADDVMLRPFSAFQLLAKVRDHMPQALER